MIAIDFGTGDMWMASSLVMIRLRSISMPGTLRGRRPGGDDDLLRFDHLRRRPSVVTSTLPPPSSRPLPVMRSILCFLNRKSMPPVRPLTILSLRAWTAAMSMEMAPGGSTSPHSFDSWAILSAWACSSSALVGMQPQFRQVPPSTGARSMQAVRRPSWAARMAAT